ncbi:MAG: ABC transporter ATP-binding protein [Planctomycetota bacterium]
MIDRRSPGLYRCGVLTIEVRDIVKRFPSAHRGDPPVMAVDGADLTIGRGEIFFLLGPSGCGKTTLLRMLAGFEIPTDGAILFDGVDVTTLPPEKRRLAMVFQSYALWPHMTVVNNVRFGPRTARKPRDVQRRIVADMLDLVGMTDRRHHRPAQLSGGQQQRVALARALAAEPRGLLLDEPLSNLDARLRIRMRVELRRIIRDAGTTAVYVTHDQEEALSMADRIAVMHDGRIVQVGTPQALYQQPVNRFVADFLGEANFFEGVVDRVDGSYVMVRTDVGALRARGEAPAGREVTCCVRPERLRLGDDGRGADNRLEAIYDVHTYLGASGRHQLHLQNGRPILAVTSGAAPAETPGATMDVGFAADDAVVLH